MKRVLHLLLLLGALVGLFGLQAASARTPHAVPAPAAAMPMDADCMEMMRKAPQPAPMPGPCKGMTLDCIAAMGCVMPVLTHARGAELVSPPRADTQDFWTTIPVLAGTDPPPEQHPPTLLI